MKTRVFLADDHAVLRAGLRMLIDAQPDMEVVGEAADGDEAIEKVKEVRPDIVLLDLAMPHHGLPAVGPIRQALPATRILVLTMHDDPAYLKPVVEAGGSGFIVKTAADSELLTAIRVVAEGRIFINLSVHARVRQAPKPGGEDSMATSFRQLSKREQEVLVLVAQGCTNQEIAGRLKLDIKTIEACLADLMEKLRLHNRGDLLSFFRTL